MTKKTNPKLIGGFVLGAVVLFTAGIMIFGSGRFFQTTTKYVLFFESPVKGLNVGAPVLLQGVKIGSVIDIKVFFDPETLSFQTPVYVELLPESIANVKDIEKIKKAYQLGTGSQELINTFVERGLRAQLAMQSLVTGQLQVELGFHPGTPAYFAGLEKEFPEIPTIPSKMTAMVKKLEELPIPELVEKATQAISSIDKLVSSPELEDAVKFLAQTVKDFGKLARNADREVVALSKGAQVTLKDARKLVRNVDSQVPRLSDNAEDTLKAAESALNEAERVLVKVDEEIIGERAALRYQLVLTLEELSQAARSIRLLAEYLEQKPDALIRGKGSLGGK